MTGANLSRRGAFALLVAAAVPATVAACPAQSTELDDLLSAVARADAECTAATAALNEIEPEVIAAWPRGVCSIPALAAFTGPLGKGLAPHHLTTDEDEVRARYEADIAHACYGPGAKARLQSQMEQALTALRQQKERYAVVAAATDYERIADWQDAAVRGQYEALQALLAYRPRDLAEATAKAAAMPNAKASAILCAA